MQVLGTAGHIDHGKTTLIHTLTGMNPDRLAEEQTRGMTIDLGFAWLTLPSGREVGIVDVPGHHRFIKNMLAGVSSISLVLLVIAADDGWMPQTEEHVAIINLLGIRNCIVVVTKCDLVDEEWLDLVCQDIQNRLMHTNLTKSAIIRVSSPSRVNYPLLLHAIDQQLSTAIPPTKDTPLLWIDRVFSIRGSGTVITGTLLAGSLAIGDQIVIEPAGILTRIRGLQTHRTEVDVSHAGSRLAINFANIPTTSIKRGMYVSYPHTRPAYECINASVTLLDQAPVELLSLQQTKMYVGTAEVLAKTKLLEKKALQPGETGLVQFTLEQPAHFRFHDRFILRHPSLNCTLGGGVFLEEGIPVRGIDLRLVGRNKRRGQFHFETEPPKLDLDYLYALLKATPSTYPPLLAQSRPFWLPSEFEQHGGALDPSLKRLGGYILTEDNLTKLQNSLRCILSQYHQANRLALGIPRETLRSMVAIPIKLFDEVIQETDRISEDRETIRLTSHQVQLSAEDSIHWDLLYVTLTKNPFSPPTLTELADQGFPPTLLQFWIKQRKLLLLPNEHVTLPETIVAVKDTIRSLITKSADATVSLATFRDTLNTSRKYALAFLEYLDDIHFTKRIKDKRILNP